MTQVLLPLCLLALALDCCSPMRLVLWYSATLAVAGLILLLPGVQFSQTSGALVLLAALLVLIAPIRSEKEFLLSILIHVATPVAVAATSTVLLLNQPDPAIVALAVLLTAIFLFGAGLRRSDASGLLPGSLIGFAALWAWPGREAVPETLFGWLISVCLAGTVINLVICLRRAPRFQ